MLAKKCIKLFSQVKNTDPVSQFFSSEFIPTLRLLLGVLRTDWRIEWINLPKKQQQGYMNWNWGKQTSVVTSMQNTDLTHMQVVFESCIFQIKDEMPTEFVLRAGVEIEDIFCRAFNPINFH